MWRASLFCLFVILSNQRVEALSSLNESTCETVAEVYPGLVGSADSVTVTLHTGAVLHHCSSTLPHTQGSSCCNAQVENTFLHASAEFLQEQIEQSNQELRTEITQSLNLYQEHLHTSMQDSLNKTSSSLSSLFQIPLDVVSEVLDELFDHLRRYLQGSSDLTLSDIMDNMFVHLFPVVFDYVLSDPNRPLQRDDRFNQCLMQHHDDIAPFGNVPKHLGSKVKFAFRRARIYRESLEVMIETIKSAGKLQADGECRSAISRLKFCSLCSGEVSVRPCRGLCLNVMRGCLAGLSEISSSWDDLVVAFENIQLSMFRQNNAQEVLAHLDGNITDAVLQALTDGSRIYGKVTSLCREAPSAHPETAVFRKYLTPGPASPSPPSLRINSMRRDISNLIDKLQDSRGFLRRVADGLCRTKAFDHEMRSDKCWNGSTVGQYMLAVPGANMIAQAQENQEVKISLIPDPKLLQVKETLTQMRRSLNILQNEELMLKDDTYKAVAGSGDGGSGHGREVIIDDEDFPEGVSGSGSGEGRVDQDVDNDAEGVTTPVFRPSGDTSRGPVQTVTASIPPVTSRPGTRTTTKPPSRGGPTGTATSVTWSSTGLGLCLLLLLPRRIVTL